MKKTLYFLFTIILFSSCSSTYFYSTLNCFDERTIKAENGDFLLDNDSLWIAYSFNGENAPVRITVFNKMNKPLYVDWSRSALIINDVAYPYTGESISMSGQSYNHEIFGDMQGLTLTNFSGALELPKYVSFIPPKTMITQSKLRLNANFEGINKKAYKKGHMGDKDAVAVKVEHASFSGDDSPLAFRSYLTTYTREDKPIVYEHEFYISNITKTKELSPKKLPGNFAERGDLFYTIKPADTRFIEGLLGATIVAGAVAIDVVIDSKSNY